MLRLLLFVTMTCCVAHAFAQDVHFSQFHAEPLLQNPANTGYFNCDYRITAVYRDQWHSVPAPYKTFTGSFDMRFITKKTAKDLLGAGIVFFNDQAGDGNLSHTNVGLSLAYHKNLNSLGTSYSYIGAGLMVNYGTGSVDVTKLRFPDQWIGPYLISSTTKEGPFNSFSYVEAGAGVAYNWVPEISNKQVSTAQLRHLQLGAAVFHVNQPTKSFRDNSASVIPRKYVLHGSMQLRVSQRFELHPKINLTFQGPDKEYVFGTFLKVNLDKTQNNDYGIYIGQFVRLHDALIEMVRMDVRQISVAFSYDVNVSSLHLATAARGGPELSLIYIGCLPHAQHGKVYCPRFGGS